MCAVQERNHEAYSDLLARHIKGLHTYSYRYCQNSSDAEDITQEAFLRVWKQARTWQAGQVRFSTWLYRIAHNLCVDAFRKKKAELETDNNLHNQDINQEQMLDQQTMNDRLKIAMHNLPARQRDAILLCNLQGFSNKQAAEILQVSVDALESLLARGRAALKKHLVNDNNTQSERPSSLNTRAAP